MNLDRAVISSTRSGTKVGTPQVLLNYARASRGPWRLKALIDRDGHPVTSRFIPVRPKNATCSIKALWGLLNSPIANAYAYSHLGKRDNLVGDIRRIPIPGTLSFDGLEDAVTTYLAAASSQTDLTKLKTLLLRVDSEVLKLYSLPIDLEQRVLALFNDWQRVGVPFAQSRYLPKELEGRLHLYDFLQFEEDWAITNRERSMLIDKGIAKNLTTEERQRLNALQAYADYHLEKFFPRSTNVLDELEIRLFSDSPNQSKSASNDRI
jgi:hypothetical protein